MSPRWENGADLRDGPGGADRVRTGDPLLAKQVLYQLSYDPLQGLERTGKNKFSESYFVRSTGTHPPWPDLHPASVDFDHRPEPRRV